MQTRKETVTLYFRKVPVTKAEIIRQFVYAIKYQEDEQDRIAYEIIKANPETPLSVLQKRLRNEYKLQKTIKKLKSIATDCGLPHVD